MLLQVRLLFRALTEDSRWPNNGGPEFGEAAQTRRRQLIQQQIRTQHRKTTRVVKPSRVYERLFKKTRKRQQRFAS